MRRIAPYLIAIALTAPVALAAPSAPAAKPTQEQVIAQFRADLQSKRSDLMAKGLTLSAEQAAKFWPLFEQYQKEQNAIIEGQLAAVDKYAKDYATLGDVESLAFVNALLSRDASMNQLRVKWLAKFQTVVPGGVAARAIQLDRRFSQVAQVQLSAQIPLVR